MQISESQEQSKLRRAPMDDGGMDTANAIDILTKQHREVEALFAELQGQEKVPSKTKQKVFEKLAEKIELHTKLEEKIFYPQAKPLDTDTVLEAFEEHDGVKALLKKLKATKPADESFDAKISVLKEMIQHHVEEEEGELFPTCEAELDPEAFDAMGMKMQEMMARSGSSAARTNGRGKGKTKANRKH